MEQLSALDGVETRRMMGEYIIYFRGKIAAYVCDNRLLVKLVPAAEKYLPGARHEPPYDGAKDMLLVEEVDNPDFLTGFLKQFTMNSLRRNRKRKNKAQKDIRRADVFFYCANLYEKRRKHTIIYICKFSQKER